MKQKFEIGSIKTKDSLFLHYYNDIIEHRNRQIRLSLRFGNNNFYVLSIKKFELRGNQFLLTETVNLNHRRNSTTLRKPILRCKQVWNIWEQLRCVAHSPLIMGMTVALLFSLWTCFVQIQGVRVNFACTKRLLNLSQKRLSMSAMRVCVPGAQ